MQAELCRSSSVCKQSRGALGHTGDQELNPSDTSLPD